MRFAPSASSAAGTHEVLEGELVEPHEAEALAAEVCIGVEVLEGGAIGQQLVVRFSRREGGLVDLRHAGCGQRLLHLRVGAERLGALLEQQLVLDVALAESHTPVKSSVRLGL